jgi:hypothetical protein
MITIDDIKKNSKPHSIGYGRMVRYGNDKLIFSVVGGYQSLYGDFEKTFEVAIIDKETNEFVTDYFMSESNGGVAGWISADELIRITNKVFKNGFQFYHN